MEDSPSAIRFTSRPTSFHAKKQRSCSRAVAPGMNISWRVVYSSHTARDHALIGATTSGWYPSNASSVEMPPTASRVSWGGLSSAGSSRRSLRTITTSSSSLSEGVAVSVVAIFGVVLVVAIFGVVLVVAIFGVVSFFEILGAVGVDSDPFIMPSGITCSNLVSRTSRSNTSNDVPSRGQNPPFHPPSHQHS